MIRSHHNFDLSGHNTFAMKVMCGSFIEYDEVSDIPVILSSIGEDTEFVHIGAGSNILFTRDYPGLILHSAIKGIDVIGRYDDKVIVEAGAGEVMDDLISEMCDRGLWGLENLSGIPGEVGASAVQNVGAYGTEASDAIESVNVYDREKSDFISLPMKDCCYGYRDSIFKRHDSKGRYVIHSVRFRLSASSCPNITYPALRGMFKDIPTTPREVRKAVIDVRKSKLPDPSEIPSAGSFFKNPIVSTDVFNRIKTMCPEMEIPHYKTADGYKIPAAWLIDQCGWKGYKEGNVGVWHLQPLVIVNPHRQATPSEVVNLEKQITDSVYTRFGIRLTPEVEHI